MYAEIHMGLDGSMMNNGDNVVILFRCILYVILVKMAPAL